MRYGCVVVLGLAACFSSRIATGRPASAEPERKSRETGLWLSLGTTAGGLALALVAADIGIRPQAYGGAHSLEPVLAGIGGAGLLAGPSLGRVYAHRSVWNRGAALRLAGIGVFGGGAAWAMSQSTGDSGGPIALLAAGAVVGGALYVAGATYEIATTPREVDRYNVEAGLTVTALRTREGGLVPGLAIAGRF